MRRVLMALSVGVPAAVTVMAGAGADVVHALPPGFVQTDVATISSPTAIEQLPNGRVVVLEKDTGRVRLIDPDTQAVLPTPALDLDVCGGGERGLLGFTHDPDIGRTGRVYAFYTRNAPGFPNGCVNRVSAFTMSGDTIDPATEQVLIDNISARGGNHNAGDIEIGNDGFLYIATGDAGRDPREDSGSAGANDAAGDLSLLNGKILRLDRFTGAPAPGNPFTVPGSVACGSRGNLPSTPTTTCQEIAAYGLRNPYRFAFDPNTSATRYFINDVGQNTYEEVNDGILGANYGWNAREGTCPQGQTEPCAGPPAGFTDPITVYGRGLGTFITAGAFVPDRAWPGEYDRGYLFADGGSGRIWMLRGGTVDYGNPFATGAFGLADMAFVLEADGYALWYTQSGSSRVRRIAIDATPPTASAPQRFERLGAAERVVDTRLANPPWPVRGGTTRLVDFGNSAPAGATAALVNLTIVRPAGPTFASAWQPRTDRPTSSNVNAPDNEVVANASIVPIDEFGQMLLYVRATTHVVLDVTGYFVPAPGATAEGRLITVDPTRAVDSREPNAGENVWGPGGTDTSIDTFINVQMTGRFGIPASGASSVALIATGISGSQPSSGFVSVYAGGAAPPATSNLNVNGDIGGGVDDRRANLAVAPLGPDGSINVQLHNVDDVVLDVVGYFTDDTATPATAGRFTLLPPTREADSRIPLAFGPLGRGGTATLDPISVRASASAVAQNLTMAPASAPGFVAAYPFGSARPNVSNVNARAGGHVRAALAFTKLSGGAETLYSHTGTQLVVDVFGFFE